MSYLFNTTEDQRQMLAAIGVSSIAELFESIPAEARLGRELNMAPRLTELELTQHMTALGARNTHAGQKVCFLGGGAYDHFIPAAVDALASRGEFFTSYTPYQAEVSQGNLQAMFEYQTLICEITGMDVSNASLYDGGSAAAEAVLMCLAASEGRRKVLLAGCAHPEYRQVVETNLINLDAVAHTLPRRGGVTRVADVVAALDDQTACVLAQHPNFFGCLEDVAALARAAHDRGAFLIVAADPLSLGVLKRPGDLGADVVVAEGQSLGNPLAYGGPYLGILACRENFLRRMPGRIAGQTTAKGGERCWVLALQTREQHIRRDKATSNICTNQGLFALRAAIYLSLLGPQGLREVGDLCARKAEHARRLIRSERFEIAFASPSFKEFVVRDKHNRVDEALRGALDAGYFAGVPLGRWHPDLADCFLTAVTEKRTASEIEGWAKALRGA